MVQLHPVYGHTMVFRLMRFKLNVCAFVSDIDKTQTKYE